MLLLMFLIYADKYGHFECSINFWQLLCLHVFWFVFDFCLFQKMDQWICIKFCMKNKIKWADAFRMLTVAYSLSVLQNFFRGPIRCERRRACWTPEHVNNRRKHWRSEENSIGQSSNHRWRSCWGPKHIDWLVSFDFYPWFGHDTGHREIRTKIAKIRMRIPQNWHPATCSCSRNWRGS